MDSGSISNLNNNTLLLPYSCSKNFQFSSWYPLIKQWSLKAFVLTKYSDLINNYFEQDSIIIPNLTIQNNTHNIKYNIYLYI